MLSPKPSEQRPNDEHPDYEPPKLVVLGAVPELTSGATQTGGDIVFSSGVVSDRALKHRVSPVQPQRVLDTLAGLALTRRT
jgi:hypothetical protein